MLIFEINPTHSLWQCLESGANYLDESDIWYGHGTDNPWDEALALILWSAGLGYDAIRSDFDIPVTNEIATLFSSSINRRVADRIPAAYITGTAWFCGMEFIVNTSVLVPRSPVAELINSQFSPWLFSPPQRILDLCTGSGCIGIAAALAFPNSEVLLTDISEEALVVAKRNIKKHQALNVKAVASDIFSALEGEVFDLILTNPPYVDASDLNSMPAEYHHEPAIGLGSGDDGLDITGIILRQATNYLSPKGVLILEVGNSWVNLEELLPQFPFTWVEFEYGGEGVCVLTRDELLRLSSTYF